MDLPISKDSSLTLSWPDFRKIYDEVVELRKQVVELRATKRPQIQGSEIAADALTAVDAALPIVQFAVGNFNPESTPDWPFERLRALADSIQRLFPDDADRMSLAMEFRVFAREAAEIETFREGRRTAARELLDSTTLANGQTEAIAINSDVTPQDPESLP